MMLDHNSVPHGHHTKLQVRNLHFDYKIKKKKFINRLLVRMLMFGIDQNQKL